jgi:c-di-GMP-binding flagellar brake protein YcgR
MDSPQDKGRDKRRFPRLPFKEAVKFQIGEYTCPDGSLSKDISRGGISLTVNEFIPVKGQVVVYLQRNGESRLVELKGVVAWIKIIPESERYQIGVEFCDLDESVRREVNRIVVSLN